MSRHEFEAFIYDDGDVGAGQLLVLQRLRALARRLVDGGKPSLGLTGQVSLDKQVSAKNSSSIILEKKVWL